MGLNTQQKIAVRAYGRAGGSPDFAHFADIEDNTQLATELLNCGDTLLKFIIIELSESEGCTSIDEAIGRMNTSAIDIQSVLDALIDSDEHAAEAKAKEVQAEAAGPHGRTGFD